MKNLSHLPSDAAERIEALQALVDRYESRGIQDTVYHRWLAEAEAQLATNAGDDPANEEE